MKSAITSLLLIAIMLLASCDNRSGYLDDDQQSTVLMLTDVEWLLSYSRPSIGDGQSYDKETQIYKFDRTGKGWVANGSFADASIKENTRYYQWTFTTGNFTVIYMTGNAVNGYWLIEKLTANELWVEWAQQDPVIYPDQYNTHYKFKARKSTK